MGKRILLVEDDFALAMGTEFALQSEGYEVIVAGNLQKAKEALQQDIDLVLLDVMLPDGNGYSLCKEIREQGNVVPIIFLTAVAEEANIVQGLEIGGDDYVTKPYRVKELLSRITAILRRYEKYDRSKDQTVSEAAVSQGMILDVQKGQTQGILFGMHRFSVEEFRLYRREGDNAENQANWIPVECTSSELRLLRELLRNEGLVLSRNQLLQGLFDTEESFIDDNTLSVYLKRLRDKLGEDAAFIETVRGIGYRMNLTKQ